MNIEGITLKTHSLKSENMSMPRDLRVQLSSIFPHLLFFLNENSHSKNQLSTFLRIIFFLNFFKICELKSYEQVC